MLRNGWKVEREEMNQRTFGPWDSLPLGVMLVNIILARIKHNMSTMIIIIIIIMNNCVAKWRLDA